jgi:hypothetical protein
LTPIKHKQNVRQHKATCKLLNKPRAQYASEISEIQSHQLLGASFIAPSAKDRENELVFNDSVCDQSFEFEPSFDQLKMPQHTLPMQQMQMGHSTPTRQQI